MAFVQKFCFVSHLFVSSILVPLTFLSLQPFNENEGIMRCSGGRVIGTAEAVHLLHRCKWSWEKVESECGNGS